MREDTIQLDTPNGQLAFEPFEVQLEEDGRSVVKQQRTHIDDLDESMHDGPVDLDDLFNHYQIDGVKDDGTLFSDDGFVRDQECSDELAFEVSTPRFFNNPNKRLLDHDASLIPGSPFSKPSVKVSTRPTEPLRMARFASSVSFLLTIGWAVFLLFAAVVNYADNVGRIIVEIILALLSFFGLFWNTYFSVSSIFKCFIPSKAFKTNTKYSSIIPETKEPGAEWLDVTIQIPVYKESLCEVIMPTLKSCVGARDHYIKHTGARCNIVVCDDGMMAFLRDNFPAAEMLWKNINESEGHVLTLRKLLKHTSRASRQHLKGLRSRHVYEVFYRMLFYYHYKIGFVARSTIDRRGKFKKASNLNSHLRLSLGAQQRISSEGSVTFEEAMMEEAHNDDGSRHIMFGNDIRLGHLICVNDADARMAETIIYKTVPEFLNDPSLGFTQHATKAMDEQRNESYYTKMLAVYTDSLYQGHFLLSSILGCHPPLVGHSIFLRTEAVKQCGRVRTLRNAQQWLERIGLHFLPVDQIGFANLQAQNRIEYWSESHVSEDFELMIHLYSLGFNGRYCAYPDTEFQEGITRTFDEEAGRHRKFSLGAHELIFNPIQDMLSHGVFTPIFRTFMTCDIPSYYKVYLSAYLCSYTSGGVYLIIFTVAAITRILDTDGGIDSLSAFNPAGIVIANFLVFYVLGFITFIIAMIRINSVNSKLLFPEYRKKFCGAGYLVMVNLRYLVYQFSFYNVVAFTYYFLGSMDHLLARNSICGATNKDSINISRCKAFWDTVGFNSGSWLIAITVVALAYLTMVQEYDWDVRRYPNNRDDILQQALFAGPAVFLGTLAFVVPIVFNPWILGWPFLRKKKVLKKKPVPSTEVDVPTLMKMAAADDLDKAIMHSNNEPDVEIGSIATADLASPQKKRATGIKRINPAFIEAKEMEYRERMAENVPKFQDFDAVKALRNRSLERQSRINRTRRESSLERGAHNDMLERNRNGKSESSLRGGRRASLNATSASWEGRTQATSPNTTFSSQAYRSMNASSSFEDQYATPERQRRKQHSLSPSLSPSTQRRHSYKKSSVRSVQPISPHSPPILQARRTQISPEHHRSQQARPLSPIGQRGQEDWSSPMGSGSPSQRDAWGFPLGKPSRPK